MLVVVVVPLSSKVVVPGDEWTTVMVMAGKAATAARFTFCFLLESPK